MTPVAITIIATLAVTLAILVVALRRTQQRCQQAVENAVSQFDEAQLAAENGQRKLRALSDSSGAAVIMTNEAGVIVNANRFAETLFNTEPDWMVGKPIVQATLMAALQDFVIEAAKSGVIQTQEFEPPGSQSRVFRASIYPFPIGLSGKPELMLILVDVTELVRLETVRRDFVANVSHELRTPLASIRAVSETLQGGALHDEEVAQPFLETIIRETDRLARIVGDLLILANAESKTPETQPVDLSALAADIVERNRLPAIDAGLDLDSELIPFAFVEAAPDQLEQVIINLIANAIKYTPVDGKVMVRVSQDAEWVTLSVSDTGIGIMQEDIQRIFERFYRVDKARSRASGGTGLGLSIVKNIVEGHGGHVKVESQYNHGSTFTVTLPRMIQTD
ncbi:MAG: ATP-binding protein [Fimbriimonadaceae bacterium]